MGDENAVPPRNVPPPPMNPDMQNINEMKAFIGNMMLDIGVKVSEKMAGLMANQFAAPVVVTRIDPDTGKKKEFTTSVAQLLAEIADNTADIADAICDMQEEEEEKPRKKKGR